MNKKTPKKPTGGTVLTMETPPETPDQSEPAEPILANATPPPAKPKKEPTFFDRLRKIPLADWGSRYYLYLYRVEPVIDRLRSGETKYVMRYSEPIDEQKVMIEHGSGRYRLNLIALKPASGANDGTEIARYDCDILNTAHPPKIPKGEWTDDPRNKKWAWAKEPEPPPAPAVIAQQQTNGVLDAMRTVSDIRREMREELKPTTEAEANPVSTALSMAKDLLQMRADNPMVDVMKDELKAMRDEIAAERAENRKLQAEMRQQQNLPAVVQKNGVGQLKEILADVKEFLPSIKELLPQVGETVRAGRTTWLDIVREAAPTVIDASRQVIVALASRPVNGAYPPPQQPPAGLPAPNGTQQPNPAQTASQQLSSDQRIMMLLQQPLPLNAFRNYFQGACKVPPTNGGGDFAEWLFDGVGEEPLKDLRGMGRDRIMQLFKAHPAWPMLAAQEAQLTEFVDQVLAWQPAPEESEDDDEEGVDLTAQGV